MRGNGLAIPGLLLVFVLGFVGTASYGESLEELQRRAQQGDAAARFAMGCAHALGGKDSFPTSTDLFFELKCEEIATGKGVAQDYAETAKWWRLAAEQGYAPAQFGLAILYRNGIHVARDGREALRWGLRAAKQGHAMAQLRLGYLYSQGNKALGMDRDFVQAHVWYSLSAEGLPRELREVAEDLADQLEWEMSFSERAEAQRMAREWKPRSH